MHVCFLPVKITSVCICLQVVYGHQHCGSHGIYPEINGVLVRMVDRSVFPPEIDVMCDIPFVNACIDNILWSFMDRKESITHINPETMINKSTTTSHIGTRYTLKTRNDQQSLLYVSILAATLHYYCDFVLPPILARDATGMLAQHPLVRRFRVFRELISRVCMY
jgi:hypothetical protein